MISSTPLDPTAASDAPVPLVIQHRHRNRVQAADQVALHHAKTVASDVLKRAACFALVSPGGGDVTSGAANELARATISGAR